MQALLWQGRRQAVRLWNTLPSFRITYGICLPCPRVPCRVTVQRQPIPQQPSTALVRRWCAALQPSDACRVSIAVCVLAIWLSSMVNNVDDLLLQENGVQPSAQCPEVNAVVCLQALTDQESHGSALPRLCRSTTGLGAAALLPQTAASLAPAPSDTRRAAGAAPTAAAPSADDMPAVIVKTATTVASAHIIRAHILVRSDLPPYTVSR